MTTSDRNPEVIAQQQALLATYRRTLAHLLQQAAQYGGVSFAPPQTANGIAEARTQIAQIKASLRAGGVVVEDELNDEAPATELPPVAILGTTFNQPNWTVSGNVTNVAGDQVIHTDGGDHVSTSGGDYAGRDIDKRQGGAFVEDSVVHGAVIGGDKVAGDKVAGDKIGGDKVLGDKVLGDKIDYHYYYQSSGAPANPQQQRNRRAMLAKVKSIWIDGLLEQSLAEVVKIDLGLVDKPDAVDIPLNLQYQELNRKPRTMPSETPIIDVFTQVGGALLILGAPGAGKTTLLLELAHDLIARAEQDEGHPIPVVFNLSSWSVKRRPLKEWLVEELNTKYDVPRKLAQEWMDADVVLPLLDGLDEVAEDYRAPCVDVINTFRQEHGLVPLAVCSRIIDYEALTTRLRLQGAVVVQTLTPEQVDIYLEHAGEKLTALRAALVEDDELRKLAETPLMLSIMTLTYQGSLTGGLALSGTAEERQRRLFPAYVERMFSRRGVGTRYRREQTLGWLRWLAREMMRQSQTEFYIERLQPNWLSMRSTLWLYNILDRLGGAMIIGLICGGIVTWVSQERSGAFVATVTGLGIGLGAALAAALFGGEMMEFGVEQRRLRVLLYNATLGGLVFGLIGAVSSAVVGGLKLGIINGLSAILCGMLTGALAGKPRLSPRQIAIVEILRWSRSRGLIVALGGLLFGLVVGQINVFVSNQAINVIFGILIGLGCAIIGGGLGGIVSGEVSLRTMPNQGIWRSARSALLLGLGSGLGVGVMCGLFAIMLAGDVVGSALVFGLFCGVVLGLVFGGYACLSHLALRLVLWRSGAMPWNIERFLDYCAERIFLRKVGGGYIFVHRLLMEHFASLHDEPAVTSKNAPETP